MDGYFNKPKEELARSKLLIIEEFDELLCAVAVDKVIVMSDSKMVFRSKVCSEVEDYIAQITTFIPMPTPMYKSEWASVYLCSLYWLIKHENRE
jgi:hypothetical protein